MKKESNAIELSSVDLTKVTNDEAAEIFKKIEQNKQELKDLIQSVEAIHETCEHDFTQVITDKLLMFHYFVCTKCGKKQARG